MLVKNGKGITRRKDKNKINRHTHWQLIKGPIEAKDKALHHVAKTKPTRKRGATCSPSCVINNKASLKHKGLKCKGPTAANNEEPGKELIIPNINKRSTKSTQQCTLKSITKKLARIKFKGSIQIKNKLINNGKGITRRNGENKAVKGPIEAKGTALHYVANTKTPIKGSITCSPICVLNKKASIKYKGSKTKGPTAAKHKEPSNESRTMIIQKRGTECTQHCTTPSFTNKIARIKYNGSLQSTNKCLKHDNRKTRRNAQNKDKWQMYWLTEKGPIEAKNKGTIRTKQQSKENWKPHEQIAKGPTEAKDKEPRKVTPTENIKSRGTIWQTTKGPSEAKNKIKKDIHKINKRSRYPTSTTLLKLSSL
ncbi:Voltage-dependent calcium channel type D subunit alpha-1 [Frankliniella fusca]|uniref:Voltage-dependent calcium channel type D subunit alpha-1 n=1 Tax=Frankliniella fusca TaxID=407009 RepID=A0AAE1H994_9NEOP|nr:Voltage-dependent calcium channel type D subunit alpha-1 [Frankliniella fusca]